MLQWLARLVLALSCLCVVVNANTEILIFDADQLGTLPAAPVHADISHRCMHCARDHCSETDLAATAMS